MEIRRVKCDECYQIIPQSEVLLASNPFDEKEKLTGCPTCKSVDSFQYVCDELTCERVVSCGTATPDGYKSTCGEHRPRD